MSNASTLFIARDPDNADEDKIDVSVLHTSALMEDAAEGTDGATCEAVKVSSKRGVGGFFLRMCELLSTLNFDDVDLSNNEKLPLKFFCDFIFMSVIFWVYPQFY